ncbi:uncharacterized protein METZ01_LOCUS372376, partial [marine metagenome]
MCLKFVMDICNRYITLLLVGLLLGTGCTTDSGLPTPFEPSVTVQGSWERISPSVACPTAPDAVYDLDIVDHLDTKLVSSNNPTDISGSVVEIPATPVNRT